MSGKKKDYSEIIREHRVTYEIYADLPDDGQRYEVFDGELLAMSGSSAPHQTISRRMDRMVSHSCENEYVIFTAPIDVILSSSNVLQPDLMMIHRSRMDIVKFHGVEGAPDLVAEILSAHSRRRDKVRKLGIYARHHVPEYWIIDPAARSLEQYSLSGPESYSLLEVYEGKDIVTSEKLPCVSFTVDELFDDEIVRRLQQF